VRANLRDRRHEDEIEEQLHPRHATAFFEAVFGTQTWRLDETLFGMRHWKSP
jgi:hypothetical protein